MSKARLTLCIAALLLAPGASARPAIDGALETYQQLLRGQVRLQDLTPQEQADVAELHRRIRAQELDQRTAAQKCIDGELRGIGGAPSLLARRTIALKCDVAPAEVERRVRR